MAVASKEAPDVRKTVIASGIAACLGKIATHPLDTLKAQLQVDRVRFGGGSGAVRSAAESTVYTQTFPALRRQLARSSVRSLYQGFSIAVIGSLPAGSVYMTTYELCKPKFQAAVPGMPFVTDFVSGLMAEVVSCVIWCPVDVVKERLQVQREMGGLYEYRGPLDAIGQILRSEGVFGLYRAYGATIAAFAPQTAINLALYERIEQRAKDWHASKLRAEIIAERACGGHGGTGVEAAVALPPIPPWLAFACASASGLTASFVTTPLDLAKLRMQVVRASRHAARHGASVEQPFNYRHMMDALWQIAYHEGPPALYKGALVRCALWVPQTAIFLASFKAIMARL